MQSDFSSYNSQLWIPERSFGICYWLDEDDMPLTDGDGILCAEGFIGDKKVEKMVEEAAKYWTSGAGGRVVWMAGARKVSASEKEDQAERLAAGYIPDPMQDLIDYEVSRKNGK
jgi:hypothetical protein